MVASNEFIEPSGWSRSGHRHVIWFIFPERREIPQASSARMATSTPMGIIWSSAWRVD
jgi:hypothetical protein